MIKSYKLFLESKEDEVAAICKRYGIKNWVINPDTGLVDVDGNVNLVRRFYKEGSPRLPLHFGKVSGNFNCNLTVEYDYRVFLISLNNKGS